MNIEQDQWKPMAINEHHKFYGHKKTFGLEIKCRAKSNKIKKTGDEEYKPNQACIDFDFET